MVDSVYIAEKDWRIVGSEILGDRNPLHDRNANLQRYGFRDPSCCAVYLASLAERDLRNKKHKFQIAFPLQMHAFISDPVFDGEYGVETESSDDYHSVMFLKGGRTIAGLELGNIDDFDDLDVFKLKDEGERDNSTANLESSISRSDVNRFNDVLKIAKGGPVYFSFAFGKMVTAFFNDDGRLGSMLSSTKCVIHGYPEEGAFSAGLEIDYNHKERPMGLDRRPNRDLYDYSVTGIGYQGGEKVIEIVGSKFSQKVFREKEESRRRANVSTQSRA